MRYGFFVDGDFIGQTDNFRFSDISPVAHNFLANIRDNTIWSKIKKKTVEFGIASIEQLPSLAASVAQSYFTGTG